MADGGKETTHEVERKGRKTDKRKKTIGKKRRKKLERKEEKMDDSKEGRDRKR